ncbi:MAG: MAGE domain-containing protein, partial [Nitrososphaeria archaeon]|nr:MAGE domain-containing protein [Nitrososphaeria archaeon]
LYDLGTMGYSIDEVAILAVTLAYLFANNERAPYKQVVELLEAKYQKWRVESVLERLVRRGYLVRTEDDALVVGWRSKVEVDRQELMRAIASLSSPEAPRRTDEGVPEEG